MTHLESVFGEAKKAIFRRHENGEMFVCLLVLYESKEEFRIDTWLGSSPDRRRELESTIAAFFSIKVLLEQRLVRMHKELEKL